MAQHRKAAQAAKAARSYAEEALKQSLQADTEEAGWVKVAAPLWFMAYDYMWIYMWIYVWICICFILYYMDL